MRSKCLIFCTYLILFVHFVKAPLPRIFPVCIRDDPQLANCLIRTLNTVQNRFTTGDLGDGFRIPRLDPLYIPRITYGRENTLQTRVMDLYLTGFSKAKVDNLNVNIRDLIFELNLSVPRFDIKANYKMTFGYLGTPMYSEGQFIQIITNIKIKVIARGRLQNFNGQRYLSFDPISFKILQFSIKYVDFSNFFQNTVILGPFVKNYLTENINYFSQMILPDFEKSFSETFTKIANQIALSAPFDEIFPV